MMVGGYTLDLYCDNESEHCHGWIDPNDINRGRFPVQFTGEFGSECRTQARKAGWILRRDGTVLCPDCAAPKGA